MDATSVWQSPAGGVWEDLTNWSGNRLSTAEDVVAIVLLDGGKARLRTEAEVAWLRLDGGLRVTNGSLTTTDLEDARGALILDGGGLAHATVTGRNGFSVEFEGFSIVLRDVTSEVDATAGRRTEIDMLYVEDSMSRRV
ncbi:hypothetical protein [Jannaschia seohaensis]|uniref:Uncharacterized protein n=1 Tax=Jannaschia seohaensis TaxID=475081 RepID=A0A2Y9C8X1_9RHOB|nr:hypothetical protein [Jannaschia seohaensis]PWJ13247.1 hypothetical protein BCF38_1149 [Jannaschia seohaensis]SSA50573.1 hypothetical protein SAMN05421539_1149 [Jannaschia seohaensis]